MLLTSGIRARPDPSTTEIPQIFPKIFFHPTIAMNSELKAYLDELSARDAIYQHVFEEKMARISERLARLNDSFHTTTAVDTAAIDTAGRITAPVTARSDTAELVPVSAKVAARSALVPTVDPDAPIDTVAVVPVTCSTKCPSRDAKELTPASTPTAAPMSPTATVDVTPMLTAAAASDGTFDDEATKDAASMALRPTTERSLSVTGVVPSDTTVAVHAFCSANCATQVITAPSTTPATTPPHLLWAYESPSSHASSKPRPIPWPSFVVFPGGVHLPEPRPPLQGTSGEFSVVVPVIHHFLYCQSWVGPLPICLQYELDGREENVTSMQHNDREDQFNSLGGSLNVSDLFLKKPCAESKEAIVSGMISRGATVFKLWHIPWFSLIFLELTSEEPYRLALFQWEMAWQPNEEYFDVSTAVQFSILGVKHLLVGTTGLLVFIELWVTRFVFRYFQWHLAWALPICVPSKVSQCVLAGVPPHECSLVLHYCHGNIFEGVHLHVASVQLMLFKLLLRRPSLELPIGICLCELQLPRRGIDGTAPRSVFSIMHHFQLQYHTVPYAYAAYMSLYSSSFVTASEELFWESKRLELNNWVSYMLEQDNDISTYGMKTEFHSLCESNSIPLMQAAGIPHNNKKMELCMAARELFILQNQGHRWMSHEFALLCCCCTTLLAAQGASADSIVTRAQYRVLVLHTKVPWYPGGFTWCQWFCTCDESACLFKEGGMS